MMHTNKALRDHKIPFEIEAPVEPFYSEQNQKQLEKSAKQIADGNVSSLLSAFFSKIKFRVLK